MNRNAVANLPRQTTALIGRNRQIDELHRLLQDPACRLLTLVGPGGIGKTRLAIAVADTITGFADGIVFVPLQAVASADLLAPAIADAAGITLSSHESLRVQNPARQPTAPHFVTLLRLYKNRAVQSIRFRIYFDVGCQSAVGDASRRC